jgi:hypothetical protein
MNSINSSRAKSRVNCGYEPKVSQTTSAYSTFSLMMEAEMISETFFFASVDSGVEVKTLIASGQADPTP